ncbi:vacuolar iron transporter homolog 3-like [Cornus florida]|uniref:vacuolar iron transporter homolog 3-like n=1 Tax=Cornus florida TaxID=4283 RepID=UPI0028A0F330|nr:vacuolar iron transporter homolog 3-like [Cornus florida]
MHSPHTLETSAEHKLDVADKKEERINRLQRAQWLRAAILGANDGLLSVTLLMLGVGAAKESKESMIVSGLAGAFAGACSMAVGEFVSVSTQRDIEREAAVGNSSSRTEACSQDHGAGEIKLHITDTANGTKPPFETNVAVSPALRKSECEGEPSSDKMTPGRKFPHVLSSPARSPVMKVIAGDAAKKIITIQEAKEEEDEDRVLPNPYKAAIASALAFLCGSLVPLLAAMFVNESTTRIAVIVVVTTIALVLFGGIGAYLGGSSIRVSAVRLLVGGWLSMALAYGLLKLIDKGEKNSHTD